MELMRNVLLIGRCEDDINMYLTETGCKNVVWIRLVHDRDQWWPFVSTVLNIRVRKKAQAVSLRVLNMEAQVRPRVIPCEFYGG
jgi:hypothetical protein